MAIDFGRLMAISEAATGYVGGTDTYDYYPHLTLTEATGMLPGVIMECQIEDMDEEAKMNELIVEAVINEADVGGTIKGAFERLKGMAKKLFDSIIKICKTVGAKIKLWIDKARKSGTQMWAKYKNDPALKGDAAKFNNLSIEGHDFKLDPSDPFGGKDKTLGTKDDVEKLISNIVGEKITDDISTMTSLADAYRTTPEMRDNEDKLSKEDKTSMNDEAKDMTKALKEVNTAEAQTKVAESLTGMSLASENWRKDLESQMYGEKTTINYGDGMFTLDKIGAVLSNTDVMHGIAVLYDGTVKAATAYQKDIEKNIDLLSSGSKGKMNSETFKYMAGKASSYMSEYLKMVQTVFGAITAVRDVRTKYAKSYYDQAKSMLVKMLSAKEPKKEKEAASEDASEFTYMDLDDMDFSF